MSGGSQVAPVDPSPRSSGSRSPNFHPNNMSVSALNRLSIGPGLTPSALKGLNSGWQAWPSSSPTSQRVPSDSSITSGHDLSPPFGDSSYRSSLSDTTWPSSRPASGTWDEPATSPNKTGISFLETLAASQGNAQKMPIRFGNQILDERSLPPSSHSSPQRYDGSTSLPPDSLNATLYSSSISPKPNLGNAYSSSALSHNERNFDPSAAIGPNQIRGLSSEDSSRQTGIRGPGPYGGELNAIGQAPSSFPSPSAYGTYQTDYTNYFPTSNPTDYSYNYELYSNRANPASFPSPVIPRNAYPTTMPQPAPVMELRRQQPSVYYNYNADTSARPPYYYPPTMVYPHSPIPPQAGIANPMSPLNKPMNPVPSQNMFYNDPRSITQVAQMFNTVPRISVMVPNMYGVPQAMPNTLRTQAPLLTSQPPSPPISHILHEFRQNRPRKWDLKDIWGHVVEFSKDQHGSRFIQTKIETASIVEKETLFNEIVPGHAMELMQDVFGNYAIQKLFEHGDENQRTTLLKIMQGKVFHLSLHMYGCRVVQKAFDYVTPQQQTSLVQEIVPHVLECIKDSNGNHVVQKMIGSLPAEKLLFIDTFKGNVFDLACHAYGCRVLQRCLENLPDSRVAPLLVEVHKHALTLMRDQFGNYIIQYLLEHGKPQDRSAIIAKLRGQLLSMARHKFASNVCEKAFLFSDADTRRQLIAELLTVDKNGLVPAVLMMKDQYANYVLQRALSVVEGEQKEVLFTHIKVEMVGMRRYAGPHSRHLNSIEKLLQRQSPSNQASASSKDSSTQ